MNWLPKHVGKLTVHRFVERKGFVSSFNCARFIFIFSMIQGWPGVLKCSPMLFQQALLLATTPTLYLDINLWGFCYFRVLWLVVVVVVVVVVVI